MRSEIWDKITPESLKAQCEVTGIVKNGPRHWTVDSIDIPASPDGTPRVIQACTTLVDPDLDDTGLKTLGDKLKLADGLSFRVKALDKPLTIRAVDGITTIVQAAEGEKTPEMADFLFVQNARGIGLALRRGWRSNTIRCMRRSNNPG